jgi:uncharacterized membrane protein
MSTVRDSIDVAVPARVAYEGLSHFENYPQFMSGVMNVTPLSETTAHMVLDLAGNRAEFDACITESRPGEFLCWEAMDGPQLSETVRLEQIGDSMTRVIAELQVDAKQLMPSERHANEVLNRRLKADLDGFKRFLENPATKPKMATNEASPATVARGIAPAATIGRNERSTTNPTKGTTAGNIGPTMQGRKRGV